MKFVIVYRAFLQAFTHISVYLCRQECSGHDGCVYFFCSCSATRVTVLLPKLSCDLLPVGTEGGGIHFLELPTFTLLNKSLFQDEIMQR